MNIQRIYTWGGFILIISLIIWGMIAAANKAEREKAGILPVEQVTDTDWVRGATTTQVTLIEYSDFQCPACALYFPLVEQLFTENSSKFRFVYRHFPLAQHKNGRSAAQASEAAGVQGKFWEMYSMLFSTQNDWAESADTKTVFTGYATKLGLDVSKFTSDFDSSETNAKIEASVKSGLKAGVNSTPTFYLNGKKVVNPQSYEQFKTLIETANSTTTNP